MPLYAWMTRSMPHPSFLPRGSDHSLNTVCSNKRLFVYCDVVGGTENTVAFSKISAAGKPRSW